jgi:uncharacterized membrane protein YqjE
MMIAESASRLAGTLLAVVQNRVDLASTELEEESLRVRSQYQRKPRLLVNTMSELARDSALLQPPA